MKRSNVASGMNEKVKFKSGATSGGVHPQYNLTTGFGEMKTSNRYSYGNVKHEKSQTVLAEANWLKAFHARDLNFFRDRISHAQDHIKAESQGRFDPNPGGNWGAVGWCVDALSFVEAFDYDFYLAVVGVKPHPGKRKGKCPCDRCKAKAGV